MNARSMVVDNVAARSLSILKFLLKDHHPRDYAIRLWDGSVWEAEAGQPVRFTMVIRHPGSLRAMFMGQSENAMGQAYVYDDFDIEGNMESAMSMAEYLFQLRLNVAVRLRLATQLLRLPSQVTPRAGRQAAKLDGVIHSIERDRQAVTYHYNTSNDFFASYLDKRMIYSCAYFASEDEDLDTAQMRKLDYICRKLRLQKGDRLLDIGCGWGGLIMYAAKKYKISALGITLSEPQAELANERIKKSGLSDRCRAEVHDYRQISGADIFDKISSIGMVEHVGEPMLPEYFRHAWRLLRPGGVFLNHGIAHPHLATRGQSFSQAYIFPDGEPVPIHVSTRIAENVGFEVRDVESLREHYMLTARHWVRRLEAHHDEAVRATDEATYRAWRLYMSAAASQFAVGKYNVYQSLLVKPDRGKSGLPLTRSDWYR
jgi:cyclopropane-fatty-acyl-phospholipid synthase